MDWAEFRMRLYRMVSLDIFDARVDFIQTPEGKEAKSFYYTWCGASGLNPSEWPSLVTLARGLLQRKSNADLVDAWAEWFASGTPGGRSEAVVEYHGTHMLGRFESEDADDDFMYEPHSGVWFDFLAYLRDRDGWMKKYDKSHLPGSTVQL